MKCYALFFLIAVYLIQSNVINVEAKKVKYTDEMKANIDAKFKEYLAKLPKDQQSKVRDEMIDSLFHILDKAKGDEGKFYLIE